MKIGEVRQESDWQRLKGTWNPLLEASGSATTFLTWEWLSAWWSAYGVPGELRILTAEDEGGAVRGLAPLRRQSIRRYGHTFETLAFIGDGSSDSDYLDFIVQREYEPAAMASFLAHLEKEMRSGTILCFNDVPATSPNLASLLSVVSERGFVSTEDEPVPCASVALAADWDEYLSTLRPRFRTKVRSVLRQLEQRPDVRFGFCDDKVQLERLLPALFDLHTRRWNQDGKPGVFHWNRKQHFYKELSPQLLDRGTLRFSWLEWKGRILACQYGFVSGSTYLHLQEGYEPASEHWNVGVGLRAWSIREFIRAGITTYDFLAGVGRHKTDWGAGVKESRRIVVAAPQLTSTLFCRGPAWHARTKEAVKAILPESVLALRRERLQRARSTNGQEPAGRDRLRRLAASAYLNAGFPAAARLLRTRYQVSVRPGNRRVSIARRRQPAGRILYYHRINNDRDPFFPSTPVDVFERHMRFIARHYKVVPLAHLLEHLESSSTETVLAVTFDDGYQDNCTNALPILERYRLPATIFLTTGALDSREPLWFEVLSGVVKNTQREYLDLEADVPRRFWFRTADERLRSNGELFTLLRQMADGEREGCLGSIVRDLASKGSDDRRDRMLTWDQVRFMSRRGIDFGGHTVTHPFVSKLTPERAAREVTECKRRIEAELQAPVRHFAYPSGRGEDFAPWNKDIVRAAGYEAAVTTLWGLNYATTDRMELRRGGPWEEEEALFAYKLDWYHLVND
jgi:CelD/BcsL family acetyltransferase involved in cellulose biosynthesis/peptidoglycan/xylan/chitin deacetylase (PgdA/CDA1 family)